MNRKIKFRALKNDMSNCTFQYGELVYDAIGEPRITHKDFSGKGLQFNSCIKGTEGQFTGLYDKNGKEIYEGDILSYGKKASLYKNCPIEIIGIVFFHQGKYEVETKKVINKHFSNQSSIFYGVQPMDWIHLPEFHKSEVIGNIHENPELLSEPS